MAKGVERDILASKSPLYEDMVLIFFIMLKRTFPFGSILLAN